MTSLFLHLQSNLQVKPTVGDQVQVTVTLPADLFLDYLRLFDSLTGFVRKINTQTKLAKAATTHEPSERDLQFKADYYQRIVQAFDLYTSQGHNRTASIKLISAELRTDNHPWSSPDLVRPSLAAAGRPGRTRRQQ